VTSTADARPLAIATLSVILATHRPAKTQMHNDTRGKVRIIGRRLRECGVTCAIGVLNEAAMHRGKPDRPWGSHRDGIVIMGDGKGPWAVPSIETRRAARGLAGAAGRAEGFMARPDTMAPCLPLASARKATRLERPDGGQT